MKYDATLLAQTPQGLADLAIQDDHREEESDDDSSDDGSDATEEAELDFPDVTAYGATFDSECAQLEQEYSQHKRDALAAFEKEYESKNQPSLERALKRAQRTQLNAIRTALNDFENSL